MDVRLIDANALKSHLDRLECDGGSANDREIVDKMLHKVFPQIIDEEPTIDAQPVKRGRWSECWRDPERNVISVICSACDNASLTHLPKKDLPIEDVPKKICIQMPYCSKCGARMEIDEDGTRD